MKKSSYITIVLLGTAGILSGCSDPVDTKVFQSVSDCVSSGSSRSYCQSQYNQAYQDYQRNSPQYATKQECETEFGIGKCNVSGAGTSHSSFVPFFGGYMLGRTSSNGSTIYPQAVYRDSKSNLINGNGSFISRSFGSVKVDASSWSVRGPSPSSPGMKTTTISRGFVGHASSGLSS